jgi:hypothetical protein
MSESTLLVFGTTMSVMTALGAYLVYHRHFSQRVSARVHHQKTVPHESLPLDCDANLFDGVVARPLQPLSGRIDSTAHGRTMFIITE